MVDDGVFSLSLFLNSLLFEGDSQKGVGNILLFCFLRQSIPLYQCIYGRGESFPPQFMSSVA